jgi:hypothetical protein
VEKDTDLLERGRFSEKSGILPNLLISVLVVVSPSETAEGTADYRGWRRINADYLRQSDAIRDNPRFLA